MSEWVTRGQDAVAPSVSRYAPKNIQKNRSLTCEIFFRCCHSLLSLLKTPTRKPANDSRGARGLPRTSSCFSSSACRAGRRRCDRIVFVLRVDVGVEVVSRRHWSLLKDVPTKTRESGKNHRVDIKLGAKNACK
jgi:hypothetical protein